MKMKKFTTWDNAMRDTENTEGLKLATVKLMNVQATKRPL
jgi:hypothetical protein